MPKLIIPKRSDKNLSAQDYWKIRNQFAKPNKQHTPVYKQDEVTNRHRFAHISEQVYYFNPLLHFLTKKIQPDYNKTHIQTYMQQIKYRLPQQIMRIKKLMLGLASVLQNIQKILDILWDNLDCQDSWIIIQRLLKDTKDESYQLWMEKGLQKIVNQLGTIFSPTKFKYIFDTFCVFMENCFPKISESTASLIKFFMKIQDIYLTHPNKYLRKFSLKALSYILSNIQDQPFHNFIIELYKNSEYKQLSNYISDFLANRLKYSSGCLTPHSLQQLVSTINWLNDLQNSDQQQSTNITSITRQFIQKVIVNLKDFSQRKSNEQESLNLFDLSYVIKALIELSNTNRIHPSAIILPIDYYLHEHQQTTSKNKKMMKKYRVFISKQLKNQIYAFIWQNLDKLEHSQNIYRILAASFTEQLSSLDTIKEYLSQETNNQNILYFLQLLNSEQITTDTTKILIFGLCSKIQKFLKQNNQSISQQLLQIVYRCVLLAKSRKFSIKPDAIVQGNIYDIFNNKIQALISLYAKIEDEDNHDYLDIYAYSLVFVRLLAIFNISNQILSKLQTSLQQLYSCMIEFYEVSISSKIQQANQIKQTDKIFDISNYLDNILISQHRSVPTLIRCSSILQSFLQIQNNKKINVISGIPQTFQQVFINKLQLLELHDHDLQGNSHKNLYKMLQGQNRQVRLFALEWIRKSRVSKMDSEHHRLIIQYMYEIDQDIVDLQTQRQVKRLLLQLSRQSSYLQQKDEQLYMIVICWGMGFAYTGFKLIQTNFIDFYKNVLQKGTKIVQIQNLIMRYLEFETFKNSRIYNQQVKSIFPASNNLQQQFNQSSIFQIIQQDFNINAAETIQKIGTNRIAKAINLSENIKVNLGQRLINMLKQYFDQQFNREYNTLNKLSHSQQLYNPQTHDHILMPPKLLFLQQFILKLPPKTYLPPLQCLHYTKQYLQLGSVNKIKRQNWQLNWTKAANNKFKKNNEKQFLGITINFQKMSYQQKQIYVHYLFGDILKSNAVKLRSLIEYIRDYLPDMVNYFFYFFINQQLLSNCHQLYNIEDSQNINRDDQTIRNILELMDSRKLLTYLYILKGSIKSLAHYLRDGLSEHIFYILTQLLHVIHTKQNNEMEQQEQQPNEHQQIQLEDLQDNNQNEEQNKQDSSNNKKQKQYKNHRKQLYKILTILFHQLADSIPIQKLQQLLSIFYAQNKIQAISSAATHSIPGILNFIKEVSHNWRHTSVIFQFNIIQSLSQVFYSCQQIGTDFSGRQSVIACTDILWNIMGIHDDGYILDEEQGQVIKQNRIKIQKMSGNLLQNILTYLNSTGTVNSNTKKSSSNTKQLSYLITRILKICEIITETQNQNTIKMHTNWQKYLLKQLNKMISKNKSLNQKSKEKLESLLKIMMNYIYYQQSCLNSSMQEQKNQGTHQESLLVKLIYVIPHVRDINHRKIIVDSVYKYAIMGSQNVPISKQIAQISQMINSTVPNSLQQQLDFTSFFNAINLFKQIQSSLSITQKQYLMYCLLAYICHQQFSIRKAINSIIEDFLKSITIQHKKVVARLFRNTTEYLRKPISSQQHIFWSVLSTIGHFVRWVCFNDKQSINEGYNSFINYVNNQQQTDNDLFELLCSISQNKKMQGLKRMKSLLTQIDHSLENKLGNSYPNIIANIFLPVLQHLIIPPPVSNQNNAPSISNLSSTLSHISLQVYEIAMKKASESLQKKQMKRLITKLKLDTNALGVSTSSIIKKNILLIKIISKVIEAIQLPDCTASIRQMINESGFDEFHRKIVEKQSKFTNIREDEEQQQDDEEQANKKKAFNGINQDIDDEQMINMNYLAFDKKLMRLQQRQQLQNQNQQYQQQQQQLDTQQRNSKKNASIVKFLKFNILLPLKTLLMYENKSSKASQEQNDKSRMYLSIVVTKIIMKFPIDIFLIQLQKVLSKLGRLLKKKKYQVRQNSRKCLAEIAKLVGPQLLYMIIRELKFHLRDNFQNHVLNYTIYYILQKISSSKNNSAINLSHIKNGSIDHILPLLLSPIVDQVFGLQSQQKQQVDENNIPTINMQSKKKKGYQLMAIMCRHISINKIEYLIKYLQKFLKQYMNTEANLMKYEEMLNSAIFAGLGKNQSIMNSNAQTMSTFITLLYYSIQNLKSQIKIYKFSTGQQITHDSTVKQQVNAKGKKVSIRQTYQLQEQAGRNKSIFKKQQKVLKQHRNRQILINSLLQFYMGLMLMLIKKKVINKQSFQNVSEMMDQNKQRQHFNSLINFIVECLDHRDNRLLNKALKITHYVINWNNIGGQSVDITEKSKSLGNKKLLKKVCRKVFTLIQKLTHSDQDLLKQCFTLLNDVLAQVSITQDLLPTVITIIKLHIQSNQNTIIEEPYKLFRTILYKISNTQLIFDPLVKQMYEYVRITMIGTSLDSIRNIGRSICLVYIRQMDMNINHGKKQHNASIGFKDQVSFYLNNLDCKYIESQQCILDILEEAIKYRNKKDIEQTGQIIIMALGTAYANQKQNRKKMQRLIHTIVAILDKSKTIRLIQKSLLWAKNKQKKLVSICGIFLLNSLLNTPQLNYKASAQHKKSILELIQSILQQQKQKILIYYDNQKQLQDRKQTIKNNPSWAEIIKQGQYQDNYAEVDSRLEGCLSVIKWMIQNGEIGSGRKSSNVQKNIVNLVWQLFSGPQEKLFIQFVPVLKSIKNISYYLGDRLFSEDREQNCSLRSKVLDITKNVHETHLQTITQIIEKIVSQVIVCENSIKYISGVVSLLVNRVNKSVLSIKKNESAMKIASKLCVTLLNFNNQIRREIIKKQKNLNQLLYTIIKITRNQLIPSQIKQIMQQLSELLKAQIGQAQFYRKIATIQSQRKQKKMQQKTKLSKLAIIDQRQYYEQIKGNKKHKAK